MFFFYFRLSLKHNVNLRALYSELLNNFRIIINIIFIVIVIIIISITISITLVINIIMIFLIIWVSLIKINFMSKSSIKTKLYLQLVVCI